MKQQGGVSQVWPLSFTLKKSIFKVKKKNYGNSNIFTMQKYNLLPPAKKKKPLKETKNPSKY
jgi:hypothetical protein